MSTADPSAGRRGVIELRVRRLKLEALEKGLLTDFSFLIGTDKETAEVNPITFLFRSPL